MRLAKETGQDLRSLCGWEGPLTHRQYTAWSMFLEDQWNQPDRHDWYQMQTAFVMARVLGGSKADLEDFKLSFQSRKTLSNARPLNIAEETALAKQAWFARVGMIPPTPRLRDGRGNGA
jgi:hypothetical protein